MMTRIYTILITALVTSGLNDLNAQKQKTEQDIDKINRSVYIELLGASNLVGISYDSRIHPNSNWGYRSGFAYFYEMKSTNQYSNHGFTIPVELNYLLGKKRHKLEFGLGGNFGFYSEKAIFYMNDLTSEPAEIQQQTIAQKKSLDYYLYSNVGYRYQPGKGFLFRIGINPSFNIGNKYKTKKRSILYPYIGLGYAFQQ